MYLLLHKKVFLLNKSMLSNESNYINLYADNYVVYNYYYYEVLTLG